MKLSLFIAFVIVHLHTNILASPPTGGGIGDGYIYPVQQTASKPKTTTTYYAKPLHPPIKKPSGPPRPKPEVFKVIIQDQAAQKQQPRKQEQIFKILHLAKNGGNSAAGRKSVKILKIIHVKQSKAGHNGGWSQ